MRVQEREQNACLQGNSIHLPCCWVSVFKTHIYPSTVSGGKRNGANQAAWGCLSPARFQNRDENVAELHKSNTALRNPPKSAELCHGRVIPAIRATCPGVQGAHVSGVRYVTPADPGVPAAALRSPAGTERCLETFLGKLLIVGPHEKRE